MQTSLTCTSGDESELFASVAAENQTAGVENETVDPLRRRTVGAESPSRLVLPSGAACF